jgi:putative ABC transport system permease protein
MTPLEYLRVSLEALASNPIRSLLTMLGVIIGVASVIMLVSIGEGAKSYIRSELMGIGSNLLVINPGKTETTGMMHPPSGVHKLTLDDLRAIEKRATALVGATPLVVSSAPVKFENRTRDVIVIGTDDKFQDIRNLHVEIGSFLTPADVEARRKVAVIGRTVKKELFRDANPLGESLKIGDAPFRVIGIMEKKGMTLGFDIDDLVFIPVETAQELFDQDGITEILAQVVNENEIDRAKEQIRRTLIRRHAGEEDFSIVTQQAMLSTAQGILNTFTYVLGGIASISLLVGGIGIMNIMLVSVRERTREIGLRKAVGASERDILIQFVIESVTLSVVGGLIGIALGAGIAYGARAAFPVIPVAVTAWSIVTAFAFALLVGVFFGIYPAMKAARLNPIDALRYE